MDKNVTAASVKSTLRVGKKVWFASFAVVIPLIAALGASEAFLRWRIDRIHSSDRLDPGLVLYDRELGWKLAPNWKGRHQHFDFTAAYKTNPHGFRGSSIFLKLEEDLPRYAVVGDSFTFGFGVNDDETFVELLSKAYRDKVEFLNFGVPGYSTDQEYLLIKNRVFSFSPDVILLIVCLANDLFDNQRAFPLQANRAKPLFDLRGSTLVLSNVPVPRETKPIGARQADLMTVVLGKNAQPDGWLASLLNCCQFARLAGLQWQERTQPAVDFNGRFESAVRLFAAIVGQVQVECTARNIELKLVLMPGSSFVTSPNSISARFQDHLRKEIIESAKKLEIPTVDLAELLRKKCQTEPGQWYFPNEGHLTAPGHRVVGDILGTELLETRQANVTSHPE